MVWFITVAYKTDCTEIVLFCIFAAVINNLSMEDFISSAYEFCYNKSKLLPGSDCNHQFLAARLQKAAMILPEFANDLTEFAKTYMSDNLLTSEEKRLLPIINSNIILSFLFCL